MRQKVVIACGLVRDATTLLFDEPLTGLDPIGIRRMRNTIVAPRARRRRDPAVVAPAAPGRGGLHARDHHGPRPEDRRRHRRRSSRRAPISADRRIEPRADLPARHRPRDDPWQGDRHPMYVPASLVRYASAACTSSAARTAAPAAAPAAGAALSHWRDRRHSPTSTSRFFARCGTAAARRAGRADSAVARRCRRSAAVLPRHSRASAC